MLVSCILTVVEESPKATAVEMIQDCQQEALIKLKGCRKLRRRSSSKSNITPDQITKHSLSFRYCTFGLVPTSTTKSLTFLCAV